MRIDQLNLIRYGKFTDTIVDLPKATTDFHIIVGPNEAGKSTLRNAISELFWGIHPRSPLDFIHPKNELRLGARVQQDTQTLVFQRTKGNRQTLRDAKDGALPDTALAAFLGSTDVAFFEKMFSLDHTRLEEGGKSILDADDDASQVLFQASAGIASLGAVREYLETEAEALWAPRKSNERAYYQALDQLEKATATLKSVAVRTKEWNEAKEKVDLLTTRRDEERKQHDDLGRQRAVLERVRRVSQVLDELKTSEQGLSELSDVVELPPDAMTTVDDVEQELAGATEIQSFRTSEVERIEGLLNAIEVDEAILALGGDIEALNTNRLKFSNHPRDIEKRSTEIGVAWQTVQAATAQLGWPATDEDAVLKRLPALARRKALSALVKTHGRIEEASDSARKNLEAKKDDVTSLEQQLGELSVVTVPAHLTRATTRGLQLGDIDSIQSRFTRDLATAAAKTAAAFKQLAGWNKTAEELRALSVPDKAMVEGKIRERQTLAAELKQAEGRLKDQDAKVKKAELAVRQYQETHQPVTRDDVVVARQERDTAWGQVRTGAIGLDAGAAAVEAGIRYADELADARLGKVEQETEFQNRRNLQEEAELELTQLTETCDQTREALTRLDNEWGSSILANGLPGLSLESALGWMAARDAALSMTDAEENLKKDLAGFDTQVEQATADLLTALKVAGASSVDGGSLATLVLEAQAFVNAADANRVKRETLESQLASGRASQTTLQREVEEAGERLNEWKAAWADALNGLGLAEGTGLPEGESAVALIEQIDAQLEAIREKRVTRIETMKADLKTVEQEVKRIAGHVDSELLQQDVDTATLALVRQLNTAREMQKDQARLKTELAAAQQALKELNTTIRAAKARIEPLLKRASTESVASLRDAITRSNRYRQLSSDVVQLTKSLGELGDGLKRKALEEEVANTELGKIPAELTSLDLRMKASLDLQQQLTAELTIAEGTLGKISGSEAALEAESDRQAALAAMADAIERFIQVEAASRLLRWAIDQYREKKQGPLLARGGAIFSEITRGAYQKFHVDHDQNPPTLEGVRADGRLVGVSGLSTGTRDQLYFALRLAALELHLEQGHVMPFVADDLFVNFDNKRSEAGLRALVSLSKRTQVLFLTHHDHLADSIAGVVGEKINIVKL